MRPLKNNVVEVRSQPKRDIRIRRIRCFAAIAKRTRRFPGTGHPATHSEHW
ncbi:hypothetical protein OCH239_10545 [Roseivivax halodurans JCM 10272]|uniref:Uncharacterized protein n=1 Tax=Roseivivax halodurans JCM 10272 TaxID=1449350 RepID=X7EBX6_9RHOB|nr:hypothetical protein OCH239_10545 [Roseivivax halodurans JCM 10272]